MTIRKERRRLEKRLKRSLISKKRVDDGYNCGSRFNDCTKILVLAAETATSDDAKNQAEITENQVSGGNSSTDSTGDSIQSSADETISTEETATPQETITEDTAVVETPIVAAPALARTSIFSARADTSGFIAKASGYATEVAAANDLYASVMIAQAILESGWGTSTLTTQANNMFGIKGSYNGQYVEMATLEDNGSGNYYQIIAKFRKYPSLRESFQDNAYVLRNTSFAAGSYYYSGAWKSNTRSYTEATAWLQGAMRLILPMPAN